MLSYQKLKIRNDCRKIIYNQLHYILTSFTIFIINFKHHLASASNKNENYRRPVSTIGMLPKPTFYE